MTKIKKLGHVVLFVTDPKLSASWYCDILGMEIVVFNEQIPGAFLSLNERDHDIALFKTPDNRKLGHIDVEHISFEIDGDANDLKEFHQSLLDKGVEVLSTVDHGVSYGTYFLDPDGHHLEVFYQINPDDMESKAEFKRIGAFAKPLDMNKI